MGENGNLVRMTGRKFGKLTVLSRDGVLQGRASWRCQCDCGRIVVVRGDKLRAGFTRSCGGRRKCFHLIYAVAKSEFQIWKGMLNRCSDPKRYPRYAGRGIKVCERWKLCFENFLSDMGPRPSKEHSIDRYPDNDGDYEPGNCRWATAKQQQRNTRRTVWVKIDGKRMSARDYCEQKGFDYDAFREAILMAEDKKPWFNGDKLFRYRQTLEPK